jgi:superfamily II DNA or RNA helicase
MQILRPYQESAVQNVLAAYEMGYRRVLYTMATGLGKTTVIAELCRHFLLNDWRVLCLAHRKEIISQIEERVREHCDLSEWEIGAEIADVFAPSGSRVVVGSVMTVKNKARLPHFEPDVIIVDEAHRAAAVSYRKIAERFGVPEGNCFYIGCTATAKRTDKQSLYAMRPDGSRVELFDKQKKQRFPADEKTCVFVKHVYDYTILDGTEAGYLVPLRGHIVKTATDLAGVETDTDGDWKDGQLAKAVDNAQRTLLAINAWKEIAAERPTLVFCAGVEHAHHSAELWREAGYTAEAIDGETENTHRLKTLEAFKRGEVQVLTNCGIYTEGTDIPNCACIVHLRPTKSWNLYVQMTGRGLRTLPGVVDGWDTPEERRAAIAASRKPDALVIDLVDISSGQDLCSAPSILDLPVSLDLQGATVTEAKRLLDDFEAVRDRVIGECPVSFQALQVRLMQVELLRQSQAKTEGDWAVKDDGFRFRRVPPGYLAELESPNPGEYQLRVTYAGQKLLERKGKPGASMRAYLDRAAQHASETIERHKESVMPSRGTLTRLTPKQVYCLRVNGHTADEIDKMPYAKAKALIGNYMAAYRARQEIAQA